MTEVDASRVLGQLVTRACGLLSSVGGRPGEDGWRMSARVHLRGEVARFTLSALGLHADMQGVPQAASLKLMRRLRAFLAEQPLARTALEWHRHAAIRVPKTTVDVTWARFDPAGRLLSIEPLLDERAPVPYDRFLQTLLGDLLRDAFNETLDLADVERPLALQRYAMERIGGILSRAALPQDAREASTVWTWRVLTSTLVSIEQLSGPRDPRRFCLPQFLDSRHFGHGLLNLRVRLITEDRVDIWAQVNHAATDGVPVQEMLDRLRSDWGADEVEFPLGVTPEPQPTPSTDAEPRGGTVVSTGLLPSAPPLLPATFEAGKADPRPLWARPMRTSADADPPHVYSALEFVDLGDFLAVREALSGRLERTVSPTAMMMWALAHQPAFANRKFGVATDVAPLPGSAPYGPQSRRTVCMVVLRPSDYFPGAFAGAGFEAFHRTFLDEVDATRRRASKTWEILEQAARVPPPQHAWSTRWLPKVGQDAMGTVGMSVIREAEIFGAPYHPVFVDGFLAFGQFAHAAANGQTRCAVTFKANRRRLELCRDAVLAVAAEPGRWFPQNRGEGSLSAP